MTNVRIYLEKLLFPGWSRAQQRRHMRFLLLGILLGTFLAVAFGVTLYFANTRGQF
jgi:hypothetical protein